MARLIGKALTPDLTRYLRARNEGRFTDVILVTTTDEANAPHVAMLSHWEVFAADASNIMLATYADSRTTRNLMRRQVVMLVVVNRRMSYYVRGVAKLLKKRMEEDPYNSMFAIRVKAVYKDTLPGTKILSGITFAKSPGAEPHGPLHAELVRG